MELMSDVGWLKLYCRCQSVFGSCTSRLHSENGAAEDQLAMLGMGRSSTSGAGGGEFNIAFVNGPIKFLSEEGVLYARFFHIVRRSSLSTVR